MKNQHFSLFMLATITAGFSLYGAIKYNSPLLYSLTLINIMFGIHAAIKSIRS